MRRMEHEARLSGSDEPAAAKIPLARRAFLVCNFTWCAAFGMVHACSNCRSRDAMHAAVPGELAARPRPGRRV
jgi:hypothetical protein